MDEVIVKDMDKSNHNDMICENQVYISCVDIVL